MVSARKRKKMGIRQLTQDKNFAQSITPVERDARLSFACYYAWLPRISLATLKRTIVCSSN